MDPQILDNSENIESEGIIKIRNRHPCAVCGQPCFYTYYNVRCCEGCKQFFRRHVVIQYDKICRKTNCDYFSAGGKCRSCRFDKCLQVGMNPNLIRIVNAEEEGTKKFMEGLERRRNKFASKAGDGGENEGVVHLRGDLSCFEGLMEDVQNLNFLLEIDEIANKICAPRLMMAPKYFEANKNLRAILCNGHNILADFQPKSQRFQNDYFAFEAPSISNKKVMPIAKNFLVYINMAKTMPAFQRIPLEDQIKFLDSSICAVNFLYLSHWSSRKQSETLLNPNGNALVNFYGSNEKYSGDQIIFNSSKKIFIDPMGTFRRIGLSNEEFVLILAILLSNSAFPDISVESQKILKKEEEKYGKALLRMQQRRFGQMAGALRYMESIHLIALAIEQAQKFRAMTVYIDSLYGRGNHGGKMAPFIMPKFMESLTN